MIREDDSGREIITEICDDLGITLLVLFGSHAGDLTHDESDIDVGYSRVEPLSLEDRSQLRKNILQAADFASPDVDLVHLEEANPLLLKNILDMGERIVGSEETFRSFKRRAFHRYCDFKPYLDKEKQFVGKRLDELTADG